MKIYTKTGDEGTTALFGGARVSKAAPRVWAYGEVDELNSVIGVARAALPKGTMDTLLHRVQSELFDLGAELATVPGRELKGFVPIDGAAIERLEKDIDEADGRLPPLKTFILPGGALPAAHLHVARTVCRRAERRVAALAVDEPVRSELVIYLNRLSDLLFTLARVANLDANTEDVPWVGTEDR
ncbi:MAG: cob(I)yrinic acid a,c-diamide adenosyltransferase [Myxococcota bacterium]